MNPDRWPVVAVTGHRPQHLDAGQQTFAATELRRLAFKLRDEHDTTVAVSGMALGADMWWAQAALDAGLRLWAYIPDEHQSDRWSDTDRAAWKELRSRAEREEALGESYDVRHLHERNSRMIADCDVLIAVRDPRKTSGGTVSTMRKAETAGLPIIVVDVTAKRTSLRPAG